MGAHEYVPPIERKRWNFPWLITRFLTLVSLTTIGVLTLGRTNSAWSERFGCVRRSIEAAEWLGEPTGLSMWRHP